jgi:ABC-type branched-subunit amino acid transport system permease subunit
MLSIVAARDFTGGSLGFTPRAVGHSWLALQFPEKVYFYGIAVSLQIVFAAIVGGMFTLIGPTAGAVLTLLLNEGLRVAFGTSFIGAANTIYGILLILCIIFMPRGIMGMVQGAAAQAPRAKAVPAE